MNKPYLIFPCKYDFEKMKQKSDGRLCEHCNNIVRDFTEHSTNDLVKDEFYCGHFLASQVQYKTSSFHIRNFTAISLSILGLLGASSIPTKVQAQDEKQIKEKHRLSKLKFPIAIKGLIKDKNEKEGIPFANVFLVQNGSIKKSTTTDIDGNFIIKINEGDITEDNFDLVVKSIGYASDTTYRIPLNDTIKSTMFKLELMTAPIPKDVIIKEYTLTGLVGIIPDTMDNGKKKH